MKVLQVTAALEQGGVERGTIEMAAYIVFKGDQSYVASQGGRMVAELVHQGSQHVLLPLAQRNPLFILYCAFMIVRLIRQEGIDLVHARSRAPAWAAFIATRITKTKFITTFHGTHRIQNCFKKVYNSSMVRGERVIAISQFIKKHIMDNYGVPEAQIDVAPRGFNPGIFDRKLIPPERLKLLRSEFSLQEDVPVINLPGRLTRWKGQELFLRALVEIKDLPWQAILIGSATKKSQYVEQLKKIVQTEGLTDRVTFVGNRTDIESFYALSDIVVSASLEPEAFGRVAVEAQAMGVPVVASAHGGSLETIRDGQGGWLFTPGDIKDLAAKLRIALMSPDLSELGKAAQKFTWEKYTVDKMCAAEWQTYQAVLDR
jgi:glycosyltransferase involved in cell wall biosynthesis